MKSTQKDPKRVRAGKRSRASGGEYERSVAKRISQATGWEVARTRQSGGEAVYVHGPDGSTSVQFASKGDIARMDGPNYFAFECKNLSDVQHSLFFPNQLRELWEQTTQQAEVTGLLPMLWLKWKGHGEIVAVMDTEPGPDVDLWGTICLRFAGAFNYVLNTTSYPFWSIESADWPWGGCAVLTVEAALELLSEFAKGAEKQ